MALLATYSGFSVMEVFKEGTFPDYAQLKHDVETWPNKDVGITGADYLLAIDYFLFVVSLHVFGNMRVVPFLASIALLFMTYLATAEMAKKGLQGSSQCWCSCKAGRSLNLTRSFRTTTFGSCSTSSRST